MIPKSDNKIVCKWLEYQKPLSYMYLNMPPRKQVSLSFREVSQGPLSIWQYLVISLHGSLHSQAMMDF